MVAAMTILERTTLNLTLLLLCAMVFTTGAQVASRYLLDLPLIWTEETGRHLMIWMVFLASTVVYRRGQHIAIDLFGGHLGPRGRAILGIVITLLLAFFFFLMIRYGWELTTRTMNQRSSALRYPMGYAYAALPVGGVLLLLYAVENLVGHARVLLGREPPAPPGAGPAGGPTAGAPPPTTPTPPTSGTP
jgi:TRAP-type transport system small permease protein